MRTLDIAGFPESEILADEDELATLADNEDAGILAAAEANGHSANFMATVVRLLSIESYS